ncbi:unnamed protein product, partial [Musa acuminata var. zebrina]
FRLFFNLHLFADVHDTWYRILVITGWISFGVIKGVILHITGCSRPESNVRACGKFG